MPPPTGPAGPRIKRPVITVGRDALDARMYLAVCRECPWYFRTPGSVAVEEAAAWHRAQHRHGNIPAPLSELHGLTEERRRAAVDLERDLRAIAGRRDYTTVADFADGLAQLGWRHP